MFKCVSSWNNLGRIYNIWLNKKRDKVYSVGHVFSGALTDYRIATCSLNSVSLSEVLESGFRHSKCISLSPDSNTIVSHDGCLVTLWDLTSFKKKQEFRTPDLQKVESLAISEDGQYVFVGTCVDSTHVWHLENQEFICQFGNLISIHHRRFSIDTKNKVIISIDHRKANILKAWNYHTGQELWCVDVSIYSIESIMSIAFEDDSSRLLIHSIIGQIVILNLSSGRLVKSVNIDGWAERINFSSDGSFFVVGTRYGSIRVFDLDGKENSLLISAHGHCRVEAISMLDHQSFVSAGWNGTLKVWAKE
jgi:WD40 repeat protein